MAKKSFNIADRDILLNPHAKLKKELVYVPDLDTSFWVREMTVKEALLYSKKLKEAQDNVLDPLCFVLSVSICDESGNSLYTEEDIEKLKENSGETIRLLSEMSTKLTYRKVDKDSLKNDQKNSSVSD